MKNVVLAVACLIGLAAGSIHAVDAPMKVPTERFYGKITAIDHAQKNVTVHNKKQKLDARFQWNEQTTMISDRKPIPATELKVGQSLIVGYVTENDLNKAKRITVSHPFKKSQQ